MSSVIPYECTPRTDDYPCIVLNTRDFNLKDSDEYIILQIPCENLDLERYNSVTAVWEGGAMYDSLDMYSNIQKLRVFGTYEDDWNGYGAPKFTKELLEFAESIIKGLNHQPEVFPIAGGAIQFEYEKSNGEYLEFEISEDKKIRCLLIDEDENEHVSIIEFNDINKVVNNFYG